VGAAAHGLAHQPDEWLPAADLLELGSRLGAVARAQGRPLTVVVGPGVEGDGVYLQVPNGRWLRVDLPAAHGAGDPAALPPGIDVWVERLPARVASIPVPAARVIGRYHLYGPAAPRVPEPARPLTGWSRLDSDGRRTPVPPTWPLVAEFTGDDPRPGETVALERAVARGPAPRAGSLRLRTMYGHGRFLGRIVAEVRVDGRAVFRRDIARQGGAETVGFEIPSGSGDSIVALALVAQPDIERNWRWGRSSTTIVTEFGVGDGSGIRRLWSRAR